MKTRIALAVLVLASAGYLFAQAEQVKGRAKDLKKNLEAQQTNSAGIKTNAPAKRP